MDLVFLLKSGFTGFALSIGVAMLVFFIAGSFLKVSRLYLTRVFILAGICSFVVTDVFLYFKIPTIAISEAQLFLAGCVGGWFGGIIFAFTQMRKLLGSFLT